VSVLDVNLPNVHSLEACREITRVNPATKVIIFTAPVFHGRLGYLARAAMAR